jgi:cytochrome P450
MTETLSGLPTLPTNRGATPLDPPAELLERGSLSRLSYNGGKSGWLITSHALTRQVLADQRFSSRSELRNFPKREGAPERNFTPEPAKPGMFIAMDPPDHGRYRKLLTGQFTVRRMNQLIPRIQEITNDQVETMRAMGSPADLVKAFALPIPSLVICELLGVPYSDRGRFQEQAGRMLNLSLTVEQARAAVREMEEYLLELVAVKRAKPSDDMLSGLLETGELTGEEISQMGFLLLIAGHETTANMLALGTFTLLTDPSQLAMLRSDPGLGDNAVEELLRYLTIVHFGTSRTALEDVELDGQLIKAGEPVSISLPAANRDPMRFADPNTLNLGGSPAAHVAFGHGIHQCLGQQLARIEMRIGFTTLLREFPTLRLDVDPGDVPMRDQMVIYGVHKLPVAW